MGLPHLPPTHAARGRSRVRLLRPQGQPPHLGREHVPGDPRVEAKGRRGRGAERKAEAGTAQAYQPHRPSVDGNRRHAMSNNDTKAEVDREQVLRTEVWPYDPDPFTSPDHDNDHRYP